MDANETEATAWARRFAAEANNRAWDLSERAELSDDERRELRYAAYAAAYHWSRVGTASHQARAELLLARVHALLGEGALAMQYARSAFDSITREASEDWEVAFAHAILADAAAAAGDSALHADHYRKAQRHGASLQDAEERALFEATFVHIRKPPAT